MGIDINKKRGWKIQALATVAVRGDRGPEFVVAAIDEYGNAIEALNRGEIIKISRNDWYGLNFALGYDDALVLISSDSTQDQVNVRS